MVFAGDMCTWIEQETLVRIKTSSTAESGDWLSKGIGVAAICRNSESLGFGKASCGTHRGLLGILPVFRSLRGRGSALAPSTRREGRYSPVLVLEGQRKNRPLQGQGEGGRVRVTGTPPRQHGGHGALRQAHAHPLKLGAPGHISGAWTRVSQGTGTRFYKATHVLWEGHGDTCSPANHHQAKHSGSSVSRKTCTLEGKATCKVSCLCCHYRVCA